MVKKYCQMGNAIHLYVLYIAFIQIYIMIFIKLSLCFLYTIDLNIKLHLILLIESGDHFTSIKNYDF